MTRPDLRARLAGLLLGTALGDSLALPAEGLSAAVIARRFGRLDRHRLLGSVGFVSDDTEQAALVAQSLAWQPNDPAACRRAFQRALVGWFFRLPWGIGWATLKACLRCAVGFEQSGVPSAGNGAAMRAAVVGGFFHDDAEKRRAYGELLATVTHTDRRAVEAALFCAEVAAECCRAGPNDDRAVLVRKAMEVLKDERLGAAIARALDLAKGAKTAAEGAAVLGVTGYAVHTVGFAAFCFVRFGDDFLEAVAQAGGAGGDTDTIAAIAGAWTGALHGAAGLPAAQLAAIHDGPFGPTHLRALAACLAELRAGRSSDVPRYSVMLALLRNLALYPVILAHGLRRLLPI